MLSYVLCLRAERYWIFWGGNKNTVFKVFFDSDMLHCEADLKMRMDFGNDISVTPVGVICLAKIASVDGNRICGKNKITITIRF